MRLQEKNVIVTGAAQGIGREICIRAADEGARVCACDLEKRGLEEVVKTIKDRKGEAAFVRTDIGREDDVEKMFKEAAGLFGKIDVLVNNVGVLGPVSPIHMISSKEWPEVVATNLNGTYFCIKHALKLMIPERSGNIINIGSVAALINPPNRSVYSATKSAVVTMTRTVAAEAGRYNIRCNCVSPGPVAGERLFGVMKKNAEDAGKTFEEVKESWLDQIPLRRLITT
ncbi:MAG: SDR family oxidoreductase, partial [Candidatus Omnitrophota bacterium]